MRILGTQANHFIQFFFIHFQMMVKHVVQKSGNSHAVTEQRQNPCKPTVGVITDISLLSMDGNLTVEKNFFGTLVSSPEVRFRFQPARGKQEAVCPHLPVRTGKYRFPFVVFPSAKGVLGVPSASVPLAMNSFNRSSLTLNTPLFFHVLSDLRWVIRSISPASTSILLPFNNFSEGGK